PWLYCAGGATQKLLSAFGSAALGAGVSAAVVPPVCAPLVTPSCVVPPVTPPWIGAADAGPATIADIPNAAEATASAVAVVFADRRRCRPCARRAARFPIVVSMLICTSR